MSTSPLVGQGTAALLKGLQKGDAKGAVADGPPAKTDPPPISYFALYSGADRLDALMLAVGLICGIINGCLFPLFSIVFAKFLNAFGTFAAGNTTGFLAQVSTIALQFVYIALAAAITAYFEVTMLMLSGNRQTNRLKQRYLDAVLRQDIAFFDTQATTGGLLQGLNDDSIAVQQAISEKVSLFVHYIATFLAGVIIAFTRGWDMTLVMLGCVPFLIFVGAMLARLTSSLAIKSSAAYVEASGIAEQTISQIRTVFAYGQEPRSHADYAKALDRPVQVGIHSAWVAGLSLGGLQFIMFCTYAVALIYGAHRVAAGAYNGGQVMNVLLATLIGGFSLGMAAPQLAFFAKGQVAGARMLAVINRQPAIVIEENGEEPSDVVGEVVIANIHFSYPSRPDVCIFRDFSLSVPAGKTTALVGGSGSGKSTVVSLIERFYDPSQGSITLDGIELRRLSLHWLRSQVGLVSQEPTLFATTIFENIEMGRPGATEQEVEQAARSANAHKFVSGLPKGYHTHVGERGMQLSGGQKQRIAIARAILKNPKVLLLDEATSALDVPSERVVQEALDRMVVGRTTLIIAHRLTTIRTADAIAVMKAGQVVERGTHDELLKDIKGAYFTLVQLQMQHDVDAQLDAQEVAQHNAAAGLPTLQGLAKIIDTAYTEGASSLSSSSNGGASSQPHSTGALDAAAGGGKGSVAAALGYAPGVDDVEAQPLQIEEAQSRKGGQGCWGALRRRCFGASADEEKKSDTKGVVAPVVNVSMLRLFALNRPEWWLALVGGAASAAAGVQQPAFAYVLSGMIVVFYSPDQSQIVSTASFYCWMFFVIATGSLVAVVAQQVAFGIMGQQLARRVRLLLLAAILRQEIGWFDSEENSSGRLTSSLATDATHVRGAVGDVVGILLQSLFTFTFCYAIALYYDWRVALLITGCVPLIGAAGLLQFKLISGSVGVQDKLYAGANQTISDAFTAIRTIQAFNMQRSICSLYHNLQGTADRSARRQAFLGGISAAFANSMMFALYALVIWFGGIEISRGWTTFEGMLHAFMATLLAALGIVQASSGFPDLAKAKSAITNIFPIIDRIPTIHGNIDFGDSLPASLREMAAKGAPKAPDSCVAGACVRVVVSPVAPQGPARGEVEFRNVAFTYPARLTVPVFRSFSLSIPSGQVAALVGESGSGKSTVVGLMERFYDVQGGTVLLDGIDIRHLDLRWLRAQMALVSQEPLLFRGSILLNIRFGRPHATLEEVRSAAAAANALEFIDALPEGFDTLVGEGGVQLSGGQKQRVAIARAVIKDPKVLLLDEATSALDAQSESVVQAALDTLMAGRTSLVIAHRLSTVRGANTIAVMSLGAILEQGTHSELLTQRGHYTRLLAAQARSPGLA